jgi:hypothetical protein
MIKQLHINISLLALAMMLFSSFCLGMTQADEIKGVFEIGGDFGGDTLSTVVYKDGTTTDVKVNDSLVLNVGAVMVNDAFETQATVGYKFSGPSAKDGTITWHAIPVELFEFYHVSVLRMGLGLSYNINPSLVIDVPGTRQTYNFENALGTVVQVEWAPVKETFSLALRYTFIQYKQSGVSNPREIGGNMLGIYVNHYF